jgi:hypothetical protein
VVELRLEVGSAGARGEDGGARGRPGMAAQVICAASACLTDSAVKGFEIRKRAPDFTAHDAAVKAARA